MFLYAHVEMVTGVFLVLAMVVRSTVPSVVVTGRPGNGGSDERMLFREELKVVW